MPKQKQTLEEAIREFNAALSAIFEPPLTRLAYWIDRQLRRSPRLYRWLSR